MLSWLGMRLFGKDVLRFTQEGEEIFKKSESEYLVLDFQYEWVGMNCGLRMGPKETCTPWSLYWLKGMPEFCS